MLTQGESAEAHALRERGWAVRAIARTWEPWTAAPNSKAAANLDLDKSCPRPRAHNGVLRRRAGRFRFLIRTLDGMACAAFAAGFPEALPFRDLNPT